MASKSSKMGFNATWSMAVGGMVGGGIFSVLGVVIDISGQWAWLSFLLAGIIALISAHSYSQLSLRYKESGGAFTYLNENHFSGLAASLSWILILGYILTISVYAFTFGHYVAHVFEWGMWLPRLLAFIIIAILVLVNLRGVADSSRLEIITVWGKVFVLLGLSLFGLLSWNPGVLSSGIEPKSYHSAIIGAASIFMAYEGFQLLSYDYDDISNPQKILPRATISAVISVVIIYIMVALGVSMLIGPEKIVQQKEIALSVAGQVAFGLTGLILVTIAAGFSTGSAINATLFSTGRLMESVARMKDLPPLMAKNNSRHIPVYAITFIGAFAALLAVLGSLELLVDAASLIFLLTFGIVNTIAFFKRVKLRFICLVGALACIMAMGFSAYQQFTQRPIPIIVLLALIILAVGVRFFIRKQNTSNIRK